MLSELPEKWEIRRFERRSFVENYSPIRELSVR
jgi:hypothetical protein